MKRKMLFSAIALLCFGTAATAGENSRALYESAPGAMGQIAQVSCDVGCGCETPCDCDSGCCDTGSVEASCGCEGYCDGTCDSSCAPECGCEEGCDSGCDGAGCCDSACGCGGGGLGLLDCSLGDPFALFGEACGWSAGGWVQMGYHSEYVPLFNSNPDNYQLHQAWLWAEKGIDTSCGFDVGGRIDYVYGTDGPDTQAFGIPNDHWDNGWDHGANYGHALPQVYMEAGYGDLSVKVGHFYTIIGWEVVTAPDNFFYSHAYTMYNSEPFTHTGALATLAVNDSVEVYGGYVFGWDSGFEDNGDAFLGGMSVAATDDINLIYTTVGGRFNDKQGARERGYMHSIVADVALTDNLQYIFQSDYLDTETWAGATNRNTFGVNQYLIYTMSDCLAAGARFEWYENEGVYNTPGEHDIYALTLGTNIKPHANVIIRPEVRFDWDEDRVANLGNNNDRSQETFGIDTIFLF